MKSTLKIFSILTFFFTLPLSSYAWDGQSIYGSALSGDDFFSFTENDENTVMQVEGDNTSGPSLPFAIAATTGLSNGSVVEYDIDLDSTTGFCTARVNYKTSGGAGYDSHIIFTSDTPQNFTGSSTISGSPVDGNWGLGFRITSTFSNDCTITVNSFTVDGTEYAYPDVPPEYEPTPFPVPFQLDPTLATTSCEFTSTTTVCTYEYNEDTATDTVAYAVDNFNQSFSQFTIIMTWLGFFSLMLLLLKPFYD